MGAFRFDTGPGEFVLAFFGEASSERVEGEGFAAAGLAVAGFLNTSDFVINVMEDAASLVGALVGALNQVAGFVVGIAAVERTTTKVI